MPQNIRANVSQQRQTQRRQRRIRRHKTNCRRSTSQQKGEQIAIKPVNQLTPLQIADWVVAEIHKCILLATCGSIEPQTL